jgi:transcriptional regulator with PAS, ATPase and Fis domain
VAVKSASNDIEGQAMKKRLVLVTFEREAKERYLADLRLYFRDYLDIEGYCIKEDLDVMIDGDLVLISSPSATKFVKPWLARDIEIIYLSRAFACDSLAEVFELPRGSRAMLVDYNHDTCMDMLSVLYENGVKHIDFVPVYPDMDPGELPEFDLAITPGLLSYVPQGVGTVIDIGWTVVDMSTMMEVAIKLGVFDVELEQRLMQYSKRITPISRSLLFALKSTLELKNQQRIVLDVIDDGVIVVDDQNNIVQYNRQVLGMLKLSERDLLKKLNGEHLHKSFGSKVIEEDHIENLLIQINETNRSLVVTKRPIVVQGHSFGHVYIVKDVTKILDLENNLRKQLTDKGLVARYRFENICGTSRYMLECVDKAKRIARIDATVLITGESGTGKELFAQSIHNASGRSHKPFVAINCAALPSALLESELFGYEEGAFTNAKKGGKKGLFESAHTGTIFLDEIAEVPMDVQAKLLRVIQEREVMRIGGSSIIPVNVRVLAATNQDLNELVERKVFRLDLFYRLNVVPLNLPALRDRRSDIPLLIADILRELGYPTKRPDEELLTRLVGYPWKGNVRELINCLQYMAYLGGEVLTIEDLPPSLATVAMGGPTVEAATLVEDDLAAAFLPWELDLARDILRSLKIRSLGRRQINRVLDARGLKASEHEVRRIMGLLRDRDYLEFGRGRGGAHLTDKGRNLRLCLQ